MDASDRPSSRAAALADFDLLILRLTTGATMLQASLIKAFDLHSTVNFMETSGWRMPQFAALVVTITETAGGIGLILGLLTPVAACAVLAAMIGTWAANVSGDAFWSMPFNVPFMVRIRGNGPALHGCGRAITKRQDFRAGAVAGCHRDRAVHCRHRRRGSHLDLAERLESTTSERPDGQKPTVG
jgi:putative oxidoreductase